MDPTNENFDSIFKNYSAKVFAFVYSISNDWSLTEDITQETFIKAYKNIDSFRGESKLSVWLNKIAYNLFLDHSKKKTLQMSTLDDEFLTTKFTDMNSSLSREVEQKIMSECIRSKILLIPENYRAPLFLDLQGYSNQEIANILDCSLGNVKIRLYRARNKMKEILGDDCSFYYDERNVLC